MPATSALRFFSEYDRCVAEILGGPPTKTRAIQLSGRGPADFDGSDAVERLLASFDAEIWRRSTHNVKNNWQWRTTPKITKTNSAEVLLERAICDRDESRSWSFQMSTSSGLRGKHTDKRRAIDLVRDFGGGRFAFVELKVGSDNPLYAAFEILAYFLTYWRARADGRQRGSAEHDVMQAERLELVVLGPEAWFRYRSPRSAPPRQFELTWLADGLNTGLQRLCQGLVDTSLRFEHFPDNLTPDGQAEYIVTQFSGAQPPTPDTECS